MAIDTVLVTGASGFIASHCILALLDKGYAVRGTLRDPSRGEALKTALARHNPAAASLSFVKAELTADAGWNEAVRGCRFVLHVAAPVPLIPPRDRDALIPGARDGALRVLKAAKAAGVQRVVLTSSVSAVSHGHPPAQGPSYTEFDWTDPEAHDSGAYVRAKTFAERAAWEFAGSPEGAGLELGVVNPAFVLGPIFNEDRGVSNELIYQLMARKLPGYPRIGFTIVDVRDVAALHLSAMTNPAGAGGRFIAAGEFLWLEQIGAVLREAYPKRRFPKMRVPNWGVHAIALVNPPARAVLDMLGERKIYSHARASKLLGWKPRPAKESIVATAESLLAMGVVK